MYLPLRTCALAISADVASVTAPRSFNASISTLKAVIHSCQSGIFIWKISSVDCGVDQATGPSFTPKIPGVMADVVNAARVNKDVKHGKELFPTFCLDRYVRGFNRRSGAFSEALGRNTLSLSSHVTSSPDTFSGVNSSSNSATSRWCNGQSKEPVGGS